MRFLADMGVSQHVVEYLRHQGHEILHLREENLERLPDTEIFAKAKLEKRVILTFNLGFGEIVAFAEGAIVSVIVFRLNNARSENVIRRVSRVLEESIADLEGGAVITVEDERHRVRLLPIGRKG